MATVPERRAYRRSHVQVALELSDLREVQPGKTIDVSRGGLLANAAQAKPVGTLIRVRVVAPNCDSVLAVGVVVRSLASARSLEPGFGQGIALAITATSEAWDRFWDDLTAAERKTGEA